MEDKEIEEIKERISFLLSADEHEANRDSSFYNSIQLIKEQYLEVELGLQQIKNGLVYDANEVLNSLK
ncbi:MAG: hypothetical protein JKY48_10630 [Flavobacteriales bacterium]|nr:hypothetical protein [Flavobacteriales bacterium]